jgi:hypothetical protein
MVRETLQESLRRRGRHAVAAALAATSANSSENPIEDDCRRVRCDQVCDHTKWHNTSAELYVTFWSDFFCILHWDCENYVFVFLLC